MRGVALGRRIRETLGGFERQPPEARSEVHLRPGVGVGVENLQASASQIRDTNVASEVVSLTKNQIIQQAATAVLAQANAAPQQVLSLLR